MISWALALIFSLFGVLMPKGEKLSIRIRGFACVEYVCAPCIVCTPLFPLCLCELNLVRGVRHAFRLSIYLIMSCCGCELLFFVLSI